MVGYRGAMEVRQQRLPSLSTMLLPLGAVSLPDGPSLVDSLRMQNSGREHFFAQIGSCVSSPGTPKGSWRKDLALCFWSKQWEVCSRESPCINKTYNRKFLPREN